MFFVFKSLYGMQFRNGHLEVSDTNSIIVGSSIFLCPVEHSIEFTNFVAVTNLFEQGSDLVSRPQLSKVVLLDA